jgi:D-xylose transport system substrate-binding protein
VIAEDAKIQGASLIAYDRLIQGTDAINFYVSFDSYQVGQLQGRALLQALAGKRNPRIVMINGSPTENNAALNKAGAHSVLDGKVSIVKEYDTPDWSPDKAQDEMAQALTALDNKIDGVRAANDGTAGGVIAAIKAAGVHPIPPVTGQDADVAAIQRILAGEQYMTVYKAIWQQAQIAADVAYALLRNPHASLAAWSQTKVFNGKTAVPARLLQPEFVNTENIQSIILRDRYWAIDQICTPPFESACQGAGIR